MFRQKYDFSTNFCYEFDKNNFFRFPCGVGKARFERILSASGVIIAGKRGEN